MKALKVTGTIDKQGKLTLDQPLITNEISRVEVIVLIPEVTDLDDSSQAEALADLRQAWHEAMTGQTIPLTQLWESLENG